MYFKKVKPTVYEKIISKFTILIERLRGLDFSTVIQPKELGFDEALVHRGSPSGNSYLADILKDIQLENNESILDIGCSKGSAIRCMLSFQFKRVDGIEISPRLAEIARANFKKLNYGNVQIFNMDARRFEQYGNYKYFYMYNPFPEIVMDEVMSALKNQIGAKEAIIIYNNPICHQTIEKHGFQKTMEYPDEWGNGIFIYSKCY